MEENKMSYEELSELMSKINDAMASTRQKQTDMDNKTQELYEETRILMVEKGKQELEHMQADKKEFDEMTANSLVTAIRQISSIKENEEKEYQDALIQTMQKNKQIEEKLNSIKMNGMTGDLSEEKLAWAEDSAKSAKEKLSEEMQKFETEHFNKMAKLDEWENSITQYGIELNIEERLSQALLNEDNSEQNKQEHEELNETSDIKKQEDDMWKAYEEEKEEQEKISSAKKEEEIDKAFAEKNKADLEEEHQIEVSTKEEIKAYDEQLGGRKDNPDPMEIKASESKKEKIDSTKKQVPETKKEKTATQAVNPEQKNYEVTDVSFYIDSSNLPVYEAIVIDHNGIDHHVYLNIDEIINTLPKEKLEELKAKQITESKKFYDANIDTLLQRVDREYGTNSIKQYQEMMKSKYKIHKPADMLKIDYDFTNFYNAIKENRKELKYVKKIAKENANLELASYEAAPNILQRIWRKIKTLKLTAGKVQKEEKVDNNEPHATTKEDIDKAFEELSGYPTFSLGQFIKAYNLSEEEIKIYNERFNNIQKNNEKSTERKTFREKLKEQAKKGKDANKGDVNHEEAKAYEQSGIISVSKVSKAASHEKENNDDEQSL